MTQVVQETNGDIGRVSSTVPLTWDEVYYTN